MSLILFSTENCYLNWFKLNEKAVYFILFYFLEPIYTFHSGKDPLKQLSANVGHAYECLTAPTNFNLTANNSSVNVALSKIDVQPFDVQNGHLGKGNLNGIFKYFLHSLNSTDALIGLGSWNTVFCCFACSVINVKKIYSGNGF